VFVIEFIVVFLLLGLAAYLLSTSVSLVFIVLYV